MPFLQVNIPKTLKADNNFRRVLMTLKSCQVEIMSLERGNSLALCEYESDHIEIFYFGSGKSRIGEVEVKVAAGDALVIPAKVPHSLVNTGQRQLKFLSIHAPSVHRSDTQHATIHEAEIDPYEATKSS